MLSNNMDANAALALALRLEALERQVSACGSDETLPLESRVAQLSLAIDKATEPHASLQKLLKEGMYQHGSYRSLLH